MSISCLLKSTLFDSSNECSRTEISSKINKATRNWDDVTEPAQKLTKLACRRHIPPETKLSKDQENLSQQKSKLRPSSEKLLWPKTPWRATDRTNGDWENKQAKINLALRLHTSSKTGRVSLNNGNKKLCVPGGRPKIRLKLFLHATQNSSMSS